VTPSRQAACAIAQPSQILLTPDWTRKGRDVNASKTLMIENLAVLFAAVELKFAHGLQLRKETEKNPRMENTR
jgi:hypothetical protein